MRKHLAPAILTALALIAVVWIAIGIWLFTFGLLGIFAFLAATGLQLKLLHLWIRRVIRRMGGSLTPLQLPISHDPKVRWRASRYDREFEKAGYHPAGCFRASNAPAFLFRLFVDASNSAYAVLGRGPFVGVQPEIIQIQGDDHLLRVCFGKRSGLLPVGAPNTSDVVIESQSIPDLVTAFRERAEANPLHRHSAGAFPDDFTRLWSRVMRWHYSEGPGLASDPTTIDEKILPPPDPETAAFLLEARRRKGLPNGAKP